MAQKEEKTKNQHDEEILSQQEQQDIMIDIQRDMLCELKNISKNLEEINDGLKADREELQSSRYKSHKEIDEKPKDSFKPSTKLTTDYDMTTEELERKIRDDFSNYQII